MRESDSKIRVEGAQGGAGLDHTGRLSRSDGQHRTGATYRADTLPMADVNVELGM
jgi:hypothetical protein